MKNLCKLCAYVKRKDFMMFPFGRFVIHTCILWEGESYLICLAMK